LSGRFSLAMGFSCPSRSPSSGIAAEFRRAATDVTLRTVFDLVSLAAVDITADETSELSDTHEDRLDRGGRNDEREAALSYTDGL
jgi:hypothetical protein